MEREIKLAFIGGGVRSAVGYTHYAATRLDGRAKLIGGCFNRSQDANRQSGEKYHIPEEMVFPTSDSCIRGLKDLADAFVILTPTPDHYQVIMECIEYGVPIICEKPLCTSVSEAGHLKSEIEKNGLFYTSTYNYTGYPMLREMKQMLLDGTIGDLNLIQAEMLQDGYAVRDLNGERKPPQKWRLDHYEIPGIHLDLATHLLEILYYLTGYKMGSVYSKNRCGGNFRGVEDICTSILEGSDRNNKNVLCELTFGKAFLGKKNGLKIYVFGTKGTICWEQEFAERLLITDQHGISRIVCRGDECCKVAGQSRYTRFKGGHPVGFIEAFANVYHDIYDALIEYQTFGKWSSDEVFDIGYAYENMLQLSAMERSHISNETILI